MITRSISWLRSEESPRPEAAPACALAKSLPALSDSRIFFVLKDIAEPFVGSHHESLSDSLAAWYTRRSSTG